MGEAGRSLTSGRLLARSALWNFAGLAAPMVVALVAIPMLIEGMGKERFGLLSLIWMGVGYFSLFDLGLGRALTKLVAERLGNGDREGLGPIVWTALLLMLGLGIFGAFVVLLISGPLIHHVLNVGPHFQGEAVSAFYLLALGLPVVITTSALIGLLEAHQRFATITAIRIPLGIMTFIGPLFALQFTPSLVWATAALLLTRTLALMVYFAAAALSRPELRSPVRPRLDDAGALLRFGGWLTVTNIVGPLMTYLDRFFVGAVLTMSAVTYYVTPYEVLSRLQILPRSITGVLFPAMSMAIAGDRARVAELYGQSARVLLLLMLPITSGFFLLAPEALDVWLGQEFRVAATPVVQWLFLGWMVNTLAHPALIVLQSAGRPDLVAKTHLAELIPYMFMLWYFTHAFGISGTAAAWSIRVLVDTVVLNELARWKLPELEVIVARTRITLLSILVGFAFGWFLDSLVVRVVLLVVVTGGAGILLLPIIRRLRNSRPVAEQAIVLGPAN